MLKNPYSFLDIKPQRQNLPFVLCYLMAQQESWNKNFKASQFLFHRKGRGLENRQKLLLLFCRWKEWEAAGGLPMGGHGSSGGERTELRSLVLWIWNRGTLKRVYLLCLLVLNLSSDNKMGNHEGVRIENLSTATFNSKKVLFAFYNLQLRVWLFLIPGDFEKCLQSHIKPIGLVSLGEKCFCMCKPWKRDSSLEAKGRVRAIVEQDSEMC